LKWLCTEAWTELNFCTVFIRRKQAIARSLRRDGKWLFSARLEAHGLVAHVDPTLGEQVLDVPEREGEHHHADHLGR